MCSLTDVMLEKYSINSCYQIANQKKKKMLTLFSEAPCYSEKSPPAGTGHQPKEWQVSLMVARLKIRKNILHRKISHISTQISTAVGG